MSVRDLIIVGAGPSGLSAAIAAKQRGLDYQVLEQGALVNSIYDFRRRWCSSRRRSCSRSAACRSCRRSRSRRASKRCATTAGSSIPSICRLPSRRRCTAVDARRGRGVCDRDAVDSRGVRACVICAHVVLAIGYYDQPNLLNVPGEDLPHVHHYYSEPHPYYRNAWSLSAAAIPPPNRRSRCFAPART